MADTNRNSHQTADDMDEGTPIMQQVLDNPFLLLFLRIAMPTVLYFVYVIYTCEARAGGARYGFWCGQGATSSLGRVTSSSR
jgi:hypothetical protein